MIIPPRPISIYEGRTARRITDESGVFIDQTIHLLRRKQQVTNFLQAVLVFIREGRAEQEAGLIERFLSIAMHVIGPAQVKVPRQDTPEIRAKIKKEKVVLPGIDIVMVD